MPFLAVGLEHKTSPLAVRECAMLEGETLVQATSVLAASPAIDEIAILSTCNRTELYIFAEALEPAAQSARAYLEDIDASLAGYIQIWEDMEAVRHLFRVASGLESQVLGEPQILAQVRDTLETARGMGTVGTNLQALFQSALGCARQARAGTALGRLSPSIGSEAITAAESALGPLDGRSALVVGGGEMSRLVADGLRPKHLDTLFVANRTASVATDLATRFGGKPALLTDIPHLLAHVDVVFAATSARKYVIAQEDFPTGLAGSRSTPLQVFDLAIPRDVDPAVADVPGVALHDLDTLLPSGVMEHWGEDVRVMEGVIDAEITEFMAWYLTRRVVPVISNLRSHVERVADLELQRVSGRLSRLDDRERAAVESLTHRLIDKMFHHLVVRLRLAAQTDPKLVDAAEFFFLHGEGGLFPHAAEVDIPSSSPIDSPLPEGERGQG